MLTITDGDDDLVSLERADIPSELRPEVSYRLGARLGAGGGGVAVFGMRISPDGKTPVVLKLLRPEVLRASGEAAALIVKKEAISLGRLNEKVPATPFVVRLIDVG